MDELLVVIPLLPLAGFLVNGLAGGRLPRRLVAWIGCGLPALSFGLVAWLLAGLAGGGAPLETTLFTWAALPGLALDATLRFDRLAALMAAVITGVGTLIHVYSVGYMAGDRGYPRYFAYLNLFLFFMLLLVLGGNLLVLFVGWEGVGLASYLLIGYWFDDPAKTAAGLKAFVVNRVGDAGFLVAAFLIAGQAGTLDFAAVNAHFAGAPGPLATAAVLLLLAGACGKSAQIPLHVWLPDAMAGPTPVSALIHAATMVTAGVYLFARLDGLVLAAPAAMGVIAALGAATALWGALLATRPANLKKVLAYSTISQLGLMIMACGLGAFAAALFHLLTHAFFKAALFLAAGAVLHALHGEEDMRKMGGLARRLPYTATVFGVAALALAGVPPLAGFFSKDPILWMAWAAPGGSPWLWAVAQAASLLTAYYMARAMLLTFFGPAAGAAGGALHGAPPTMTVPLGLLAVGAVAAGWLGLPAGWRAALGLPAPLAGFLAPVLPEPVLRAGVSHATEAVLAGVAVAAAVAGIAVGAWRHRHGAAGAVIARTPLPPAVEPGGDPFDAAYRHGVLRPLGWLSATLLGGRIEPGIAALTLAAPARLAPRLARALARLQSGDPQAYVLYALAGLAIVLGWGALRA